jgi:hypothetical protein
MCAPSVVADDWIIKGCHIHVNGIELCVRPDHRGEVIFVSFFGSVPQNSVNEAIRIASNDCLPDQRVRRQWISSIERAMVHLFSQSGELRGVALGRLAELHSLRTALRRMED